MTGDIFIYGYIGTDKRQGEISFEDVNQQIRQNAAASELIVHIVSGGGDVFEGEAIYNALKNSGKKITTNIEGTCASIATLIAAAGDYIIMNRTARFMIHNPKISGLTQAADSNQLRQVASQLDQVKTLLVGVYDRKTTIGKEKLWELYDNETWFTADEAQKIGFVDEVVDAIKAVAKVDLNKIKMQKNENWFVALFKGFAKMPKVKNMFSETLQTGQVIMVMSEDEDWTGKQVVFEDGSPLPSGEHALQSGKIIVVDDSSVITEVKEAPAPEKQEEQPTENTEEMENAKIKELEAQLAEVTAAKEKAEADLVAARSEATTARTEIGKIQNKQTEFEKEFLKLKEEMQKTIGDTSGLPRGPVIKNADGSNRDFDPMAEDLGNAYVTSRPSSTFKR